MTAEVLCKEKIAELEAIETNDKLDPRLHERANEVIATLNNVGNSTVNDLDSNKHLMNALLEQQRLSYLAAANLQGGALTHVLHIMDAQPKWRDTKPLEVEESQIDTLANRLIYSSFQHTPGKPYPDSFPDAPPAHRDKTALMVGTDMQGITERVMAYTNKHDIPIEPYFFDYIVEKAIIEESSMDQIKAISAYNEKRFEGMHKRISMRTNAPEAATVDEKKDPKGKKEKAFDLSLKPFLDVTMSNNGSFVLTKPPSREDAAQDKIDYKDYLKLFFELIDQPWKQIEQAHKHLIGKLNAADKVHIVDKESGTNIRFSIKGSKWVNSLMLRNIPGSEVFAAPVKDSVNGTLAAKGRFKFKTYGVIEDIKLKFENGRIVDWDAKTKKQKEELGKIIKLDDGKGEGSRFLGEFGIGTNPWLRQHVINPLLVEKIKGSFHLAIGKAYTYDKYDGEEVKVDNGNRSASDVHWDVTSLMSKNSRMVLDEGTDKEYTVLKDGNFPDKALRVLNEGWNAIPPQDRPNYWQNRLAKGEATSDKAVGA
ncbi:MAG: aminopeptidase [Rickettsiales bacterium]